MISPLHIGRQHRLRRLGIACVQCGTDGMRQVGHLVGEAGAAGRTSLDQLAIASLGAGEVVGGERVVADQLAGLDGVDVPGVVRGVVQLSGRLR